MPGRSDGFKLTRRNVLQALAAVGAGTWVGCAEPEPLAPDAPGFELGVACGDVTAASALLWTRSLEARELEWVVWQGEEGTEVVRSGRATPSEAGAIHVEVDGLSPATRYRYAFFERTAEGRGRQSRVGRFRTAPADDSLAPLILGATCCTRLGLPMRTLDRAAARSDLDLFLLLGDTCYADGAWTLEEFRAKWAATIGHPSQRALRAAHGLIATWDDHEFDNNWAGETIDPAKRAAAAAAFFEHQPVRRDPAEPDRVWRRLRWGRTAEIFVLDARGDRRPSTRLTPQAEYLSRAQMDWLKQGLAESTAVFKVVMNSVPIAEYPGALFQSFDFDRWEGYPAQRREILQHIDDARIPGVLWVAGDFHLASVGRVSREPPGRDALEVLVGPGAQSANPSPTYPGPPQFDWSSGINNYTVLRLDPVSRSVQIAFHDEHDEVAAELTYTL